MRNAPASDAPMKLSIRPYAQLISVVSRSIEMHQDWVCCRHVILAMKQQSLWESAVQSCNAAQFCMRRLTAVYVRCVSHLSSPDMASRPSWDGSRGNTCIQDCITHASLCSRSNQITCTCTVSLQTLSDFH